MMERSAEQTPIVREVLHGFLLDFYERALPLMPPRYYTTSHERLTEREKLPRVEAAPRNSR